MVVVHMYRETAYKSDSQSHSIDTVRTVEKKSIRNQMNRQ